MGMQVGGQFVQVKRDTMRLVCKGCLLDDARIFGHLADQRQFALIAEKRRVAGSQRIA